MPTTSFLRPVAVGAVLTLSACATRPVGVCGNAPFSYQLSPQHPTGQAVTLLAVQPNGSAMLRSTQTGRQVALRPGHRYFAPQFSDTTVFVVSTDPVHHTAEIVEQLAP